MMVLFVCISGEDNVVDLVTLDKGLALKCLKDGLCDKVVEEDTDKGYDEVCSIILEGCCDMTLEDLRVDL